LVLSLVTLALACARSWLPSGACPAGGQPGRSAVRRRRPVQDTAPARVDRVTGYLAASRAGA